jgi:hypothetical protein
LCCLPPAGYHAKRSIRIARADHPRHTRQREPLREATALLAGAAKQSDALIFDWRLQIGDWH